jgi:hypothetical protein
MTVPGKTGPTEAEFWSWRSLRLFGKSLADRALSEAGRPRRRLALEMTTPLIRFLIPFGSVSKSQPQRAAIITLA